MQYRTSKYRYNICFNFSAKDNQYVFTSNIIYEQIKARSMKKITISRHGV